MVFIPDGVFAPVIRAATERAGVPVAAYFLDERPVTNGEFLAFVRANPRWRRSQVPRLFADTEYLAHWAGDLDLGPRAPAGSPVVRVSWFATRAYAAWAGKRLPTIAEWERAAAAGFNQLEGKNEPGYLGGVLAWYSTPTPAVPPAAGAGRPNVFGARDLLSLVWEWADDFSTVMMVGDSRNAGGNDFFCGGAANRARDPSDYAAFMRMGYRSSLRANYTVANLGFRCAQDLPPQAPANP
ncbi:MAG: hypothetical protein A3G75_06880 [Verrucomicrobia bacterium RIFCSPLOWO2_12_FULL_64_8]|nr:MAG: hypothetical protein A3G75_06880 [Verrucomicrobia bacterium RIFCSPLOWO2_12_FULL_64_8]